MKQWGIGTLPPRSRPSQPISPPRGCIVPGIEKNAASKCRFMGWKTDETWPSIYSWWLNHPFEKYLSNWIIPPGRDENKKILSCHHPDLQIFSCLWKVQEIRDFNAIYWLQKETPFQQYWELTESWSSHVASFISNCQLWNKKRFTHTELKRSGRVETKITFLCFEFKNSQTAHSQTLGSSLTLNSARQ